MCASSVCSFMFEWGEDPYGPGERIHLPDRAARGNQAARIRNVQGAVKVGRHRRAPWRGRGPTADLAVRRKTG
jgi:hypothetical protein